MEKTLGTKKNRSADDIIKMIFIVILWLIVWEIADRIIDNKIILSGPVHIIQALIKNIKEADFIKICMVSFIRIAMGFILSFISGFVLAVICYKVKLVKDLLEPVIIMLKTVPMISFVIMLLIWVGNQALTIYLAFLIVLPLVYTNTLSGFENVSKEMLEMSYVFGMSPFKRFMYIYRPAFMPFLISSCKISLGMSWKSGIMAEVIATPRPSIGREMYVAKQYLMTDDLFAWTIIVIILSVLFEKIFMFFVRQAAKPCGSLIIKEK